MYLYGASVQGIQDFIFKTNKLKEIVGASEIVKSIADEFENNYNPDNILLNAAGNIKAIFNTEEECKKVVFNFPKSIQKKAYGITILQAVVELGDHYTQEDINKLEAKLKVQRNKPSIPLDLSLNIMQLNASTAKPSVNAKEDMATSQKLDAYNLFIDENPDLKEFKELSRFSNGKNKIAIIHIDGNGLGKLVPKLGAKLSAFSKKLDKATKQAFKDAKDDSMSVRDVILGGDDVTVICNANDALAFTQNFLQNFEENTSKIEELNGLSEKLTACAGIAYTNEKYPFHYAVSLAETLCGHAKNASNRETSCLMFHNIQSSNFQTWDKFVEDELTIVNDKESIRCDFGPYYIESSQKQPSIKDFRNMIGAYACEDSPKGKLRNWLSELYKSSEYADLMLTRINEMAAQSNWNSCIMNKNLERFDKQLSNDRLIIEKDGVKKTPIYDVLQILSVTEEK